MRNVISNAIPLRGVSNSHIRINLLNRLNLLNRTYL